MTRRIRVLLIEDNPGDARLIRETLAGASHANFEVECFDRLSTGLTRLGKGDIDVVLLDLSLPDARGLEAFVEAHTQVPHTPIVVLTGLDDQASALKAVESGAQDYLVKGQTDTELLARSLLYAVERHRMLTQLGKLAVMKERERIAMDLHDDVIQSLVGAGMLLQVVAADSEAHEYRPKIQSVTAELSRLVIDVRNYIYGLRPDILADQPLDQALRDLAEDFQDRTGVVTIVDADVRIAAQLDFCAGELIQFTREVLSNVARHAAATTCRINLRRSDGHGVLEIGDDGKGFDAAHVRGRGIGLCNLQERATSLGARVDIETAPAKGTTVRVVIPL